MELKPYSVGKTIVKTAEVPVVVVVGSKILPQVVSHIGIDIDENTAMIALSLFYGVFKGFSNWVKNRKNGKK